MASYCKLAVAGIALSCVFFAQEIEAVEYCQKISADPTAAWRECALVSSYQLHCHPNPILQGEGVGNEAASQKGDSGGSQAAYLAGFADAQSSQSPAASNSGYAPLCSL